MHFVLLFLKIEILNNSTKHNNECYILYNTLPNIVCTSTPK